MNYLLYFLYGKYCLKEGVAQVIDNPFNENHLKQLVKFTFLYIGDIKEAKAIVLKSREKCIKLARPTMDNKEIVRLLKKQVLDHCHKYTKSIHYFVQRLVKAPVPSLAWTLIHHLPKSTREVAISRFFLQESSAEMAKSLSIPPGNVAMHSKKANEKLGIHTQQEEKQFIDKLQKELQFIDRLDFSELNEHQHLKAKDNKPTRLKWFVPIAIIVLIVVALTILSKVEMHMVFEENEPGKVDETESQVGNPNSIPPVNNTPYEPREIHDLSLKIAAFELFYNDTQFYSAKQSKFEAARRLYYYISIINLAEERNIFLDKYDQLAVEGNNRSQINWMKNFENQEVYLQKMLETFQITEEQYIEYYLGIQNEASKYLIKLHELDVAQKELEEIYYNDLPPAYYEQLGLTKLDVFEMKNELESYDFSEVTEKQFDLPFDLTGSYMHIVQLDNGQYVFENPLYFSLHTTKYNLFLEDVWEKYEYQRLNRITLDNQIAFFTNYETDSEQEKQLASEVAEVYKVLKQSIDWELHLE